MPNTYYKVFNQTLKTKYKEALIGDIRRDLSSSVKKLNADLYDEIFCKANMEDFDINSLLKYYAISQLLKETKTDGNKNKKEQMPEGMLKTANPNIKMNINDEKFYKLDNENSYVIDEAIKAVYDDGTYCKEKRLNFSSYTLKEHYNLEDILCAMQLIDPRGIVVGNKHHVVEILDMRKEFVQRFKYSGISGRSNDIIAALGNRVCAPIESGYYIDKKFHFYRWSDNQKMFIRNIKLELFSPLLTDYIFESNRKVIRKEYNGAI